jgi:hypothetical protein
MKKDIKESKERIGNRLQQQLHPKRSDIKETDNKNQG